MTQKLKVKEDGFLLPAHRPERAIALLEDFADNKGDYDVYKVHAELKFLIGEQLAEEKRKEEVTRKGY